MKQNVDLTANRLFSTNDFDSFIVKAFPNLRHHPWSYEGSHRIYSDSDIGQKDSLIICGNSKERQAQRFNRMLDYGYVCECCGTELLKPWAKHFSLCEGCYAHLDTTCRKLWKYKDDPVQDSSDRIVIEMNRR